MNPLKDLEDKYKEIETQLQHCKENNYDVEKVEAVLFDYKCAIDFLYLHGFRRYRYHRLSTYAIRNIRRSFELYKEEKPHHLVKYLSEKYNKEVPSIWNIIKNKSYKKVG